MKYYLDKFGAVSFGDIPEGATKLNKKQAEEELERQAQVLAAKDADLDAIEIQQEAERKLAAEALVKAVPEARALFSHLL